MSRQAIFTKVAEHLLTQNERARGFDHSFGYNRCMYRTDDGKKCAIGCLIPDDRYSSALEGKIVFDSGVFEAIDPDLGATRDDFGFLDSLQNIHDRHDPSRWPTVLKIFAEHLGLTMPTIGVAQNG